MKVKKDKKKVKSLKIWADTHQRLKIHVAKTEGSMTDFGSLSIEEKIKQSK